VIQITATFSARCTSKLQPNLHQNFFKSQVRAHTNYPTTKVKMPSTHKKEKPWDTDDIDKWKASYFQLFSILN